jgi:hypothetical protein
MKFESATEMVFLSASGHNCTALSVSNVQGPANLWTK